MQQLNILNYLKKQMEASYFHYPWHLSWQENSPYAELVFQIELENPNRLTVLDYIHKTDQTTIHYELKALFYNGNILDITSDNYLTAIKIDSIQGITVGELSAVISYLKEITSQVRIQWMEFLNSEMDEVFKIEWDDLRFKEIKNSRKESNQFTKRRLFFPESER